MFSLVAEFLKNCQDPFWSLQRPMIHGNVEILPTSQGIRYSEELMDMASWLSQRQNTQSYLGSDLRLVLVAQ